MKKICFPLILIGFFITGQSQNFQVTVVALDDQDQPLDKFHRVFFYRGVNLIYTKSLNDQGQCSFSITPQQIDTIRNEFGERKVSHWQAVVMSPDDVPLKQKTFMFNLSEIDIPPIQYIRVDPDHQSLFGVITNSEDNSPVSNADVHILRSRYTNTFVAKTDSFGYFTFDQLPMGNYPLELSFQGTRIPHGQRETAYVPNLSSLDIRLKVLPVRRKYSCLPLAPLTTLKYPSSKSLFLGEATSLGILGLSIWGIHHTRLQYKRAFTQREAAVQNTLGNGFKSALIVSGTSFLTFYIIKLTMRKRHKQ